MLSLLNTALIMVFSVWLANHNWNLKAIIKAISSDSSTN